MKYDPKTKNYLWELTSPKSAICIICNSKAPFTGIKKKDYDIFSCPNCIVKFCLPRKEPNYDKVTEELYKEYIDFSHKIKKVSDIISALNENSPTFAIPLEYLKGKRGLKILDVGCSYGYFTYALRRLGYDAYGFDVSEKAISFAKKEFGDYFSTNLPNEKYDVVIAIETIEHVENPMQFIDSYLAMLNPGGALIITTPNREFYMRVMWVHILKQIDLLDHFPIEERLKEIKGMFEEHLWFTDGPPVHLTLFHQKTFEVIAKLKNLKVYFIDKYKEKGELPPILGVVLQP